MCKTIESAGTKLINNGTDVTIVTNSHRAADVMKASRVLVVRGISTAIIELSATGPLDERMIVNYGEKTGVLVFLDEEIYKIIKNKIKLPPGQMTYIKDATIEEIIEGTRQALKSKMENGGGSAYNFVHYV